MADKKEGVAFSIHIVGNVTNKTWIGDFRAKERLSFRDQLNRDRARRELLGPEVGTADAEALSIAVIISELSVRLTEAPAFWTESQNGLNLQDDNLIMEIYNKAIKIEKDALSTLVEAGEEAKKELKEKSESK